MRCTHSSRRTIAVVVPAHNEERAIGATLAAVLAQTRPPDEVHVVCNACSDRTEQLASRFPVTVHSTLRPGVSRARNIGARASAAELLLFVDADVSLARTLLATIEQRTSSAVAPLGTVRVRPDLQRYALQYGAAALLIEMARAASNGLIFCDRDIFLRAGGFPEDVRVGEDNLLMRSARRLPGTHYDFVRRPAAVSSTRRLQRWGQLKLLSTWVRSLTARDKRRVRYEAVR